MGPALPDASAARTARPGRGVRHRGARRHPPAHGARRRIVGDPIPLPPPGIGYTNFCDEGGRFGPHNQNQNQHSPYVQRDDNRVYLTYFNAGLRIYDISDPRQPTEVGYFLPPEPVKRYGPNPVRVLVKQTEDVLVDARGYIYITDKNEGIWILKFHGDAK